MKKAQFCLTLLLLCSVSIIASAQNSLDLRYTHSLFIPKENVLDGHGGEAMIVLPLSRTSGFGIGAGYELWELDYTTIDDEGFLIELDGEGELLPLGISYIYRPELVVDNLVLSWSAGVRYIQIDADGRIRASDESSYLDAKIDLGDAVVGRFTVDAALSLVNGLYFLIGAGYQVDIDAANVKLTSNDQEFSANDFEQDLESSFFYVGLNWFF